MCVIIRPVNGRRGVQTGMRVSRVRTSVPCTAVRQKRLDLFGAHQSPTTNTNTGTDRTHNMGPLGSVSTQDVLKGRTPLQTELDRSDPQGTPCHSLAVRPRDEAEEGSSESAAAAYSASVVAFTSGCPTSRRSTAVSAAFFVCYVV